MLKLKFTAKNNIDRYFNSGWFLLAAVLIALFFRFSDLSNRPLHSDEAVNAVKFNILLEQGEYKYDPIEYHGPSLYYFTLVSAWLNGDKIFQDLDETTIRIVPITFNLLLFLLLFLIRKSIPNISLIVITLLLIISPYINFYSRYYIHESLFATLAFSMIITFYKFYVTSRIVWIILSGISAGLLFATKETSVVVLFSFLISLLLTKTYRCLSVKKVSLFIISFVAISIIFYSSFFTNPNGIIDAVLTFKYYLVKSAEFNDHIQPWYYYLKLFSYNKLDNYFISEVIILFLGLVGIIFSFRKNFDKPESIFFRFVSIFILCGSVLFSIFSYKTPWNMFYLWIGFIFLSGNGFENLLERINTRTNKIIFSSFVLLLSMHLIFQLYLTSYKFPSSPNNPFTYSQTTEDIYNLTNDVDKLIDYKKDIFINVIAEENQYWPLPWYFRKAKNIAWNNSPTNDIFKFDLIIAQPKFVDEIINKLYTIPPAGEKNLFVPFIEQAVQIRPGNYFSSYIMNDLYVELINSENNNQ